MTDEPYRWLEAIGNRREYVEHQLKGASPVFSVSVPEGILLFGIGTGQSKVFEIYDRHGFAGLGHPADLERVRQQMIDQAHLEGFTRASHDVALRRLVSFGLSPQLKNSFEQIFSPPFLVRVLLAEVAEQRGDDLLARVDFDGVFTLQRAGWLVAAEASKQAEEAQAWLVGQSSVAGAADLHEAARLCLEAWHRLTRDEPFSAAAPEAPRNIPADREVEAALLQRQSRRTARYQPLSAADLGLAATPPP